MQKDNIEKLVEETINSFDGVQRAEGKPFLLTRIYARMKNNEAGQSIWAKAGSFLSKPSVALAGLLVIILINAAIILQYSGNDNTSVQNTTTAKDDFAINVISIYETENQEP